MTQHIVQEEFDSIGDMIGAVVRFGVQQWRGLRSAARPPGNTKRYERGGAF